MKWMVAIISAIFNFQFTNNLTIDQFSIVTPVPTPTAVVRKSFVLLDVPFTSQAPGGNWKNPRLADGCEESAALMAVAWAGKASIMGKTGNARTIEDIWDWQVENYGEARDTGAEDTAERILGGYFKYKAYSVQRLASSEEIKTELARGNVVIVPVDGRGLNPNYKAPGPERHMILIRGYDDISGEFITNDPGTRRGEKYRYKYQKLFNAIRDYPSGNHELVTGVEKRMIVVENYSN